MCVCVCVCVCVDGSPCLCIVQDIELEWNFTSYAAKLLVNHTKNRYVNIIPCECVGLSLSLLNSENKLLKITKTMFRVQTLPAQYVLYSSN